MIVVVEDEKELNAQLPDIMVHGIIRDKNGKDGLKELQ